MAANTKNANIGARLDRLPNSGWHIKMWLITAFALLVCWSNAIGGSVQNVLLNELHWLEPGSTLLAMWGTTYTAGQLFGALVGGPIGDKIGRKKSILLYETIHIIAMIGGAAGGLYAGLSQTHRFATGSGGLPAVLLYIGDDTMMHMVNIIIAMVIGSVITAILTFVLGNIFDRREKTNGSNSSTQPTPVPAGEDAVVANDGATTTICVSPVTGIVHPVSESADAAFSSLMMGDGAAIDPTDGTVVAPVSGVVTVLFPTKHAIGITSDDGVEILIHIGIDTVNLEGKPFTMNVAQGDRVTAGQRLGTFDIKAIEDAGYSAQTMVLVTNKDAWGTVSLVPNGTVNAGDQLLGLSR